jgi:DNA-directed RNA polymerase specialized sigma24 family protein
MARDPRIEARLQRWADWVSVGDGSGYPVMSVLHSEWQPPSPGVTPTMKVSSSSDVRATHRAVGRLSQRLANTLVVHYCMKLPLAEQAMRLDCAESTVMQRVDLAHRQLLGLLDLCAA